MKVHTIIFLTLFTAFAVLHYVFLGQDQYYHWSWLDNVMHFAGGAIIVFGLYTLRDIRLFPGRYLRVVPIVSIVFAIAVAWEIFGYLALQSYDRPDYALDTTLDITFGVVGGLCGVMLARVMEWYNRQI